MIPVCLFRKILDSFWIKKNSKTWKRKKQLMWPHEGGWSGCLFRKILDSFWIKKNSKTWKRKKQLMWPHEGGWSGS
jgi:hypothetical protein